ncbi:hypothetical protein MATR_12430 [Marivirga tractuosa]|uniref:Uncharacterized protein n=1 Tax=Marivirga tractuosa (strain ATCC 23168 / DSM 4126 / NBRC 15989 / NCIMB 1408 / VKM B-1430 / H-43) TaxID=643867 RepID=E4TVL4_MARTH|nr:DUF6624 domain-containing protein [Marivirga tractuosa]ADR21127.1 hypothetical protein Ftrac_1132 [Marivirga tractuosa DSM 4126]BDD14418.1 hypothetical protein MATR_12430 [Marivirga tractuosa]
MKKHLVLTISVLFIVSIPSYSQNQSKTDLKKEAKTIEDLTIQSLKLRQQVNPEMKNQELINEIKILDSTLLNKVTLFLNEYGWKSKKEIGELANMGLFLAIQHSSTEEMESFKEIIEQAYHNNKIEKSKYALYRDRLRVRNDLPQIYGTQYYFDEESSSFRFNKIEDFENINKRRRKMGLPKIEKYAKQNNIALHQ